MERIDVLPGWSAVDANAARLNQPGFDVIARHDGGRDIHVSVKSKTTGGGRLSFEIGRSFRRHPADVYAFVDTTQAERGWCTSRALGRLSGWPLNGTASTSPIEEATLTG